MDRYDSFEHYASIKLGLLKHCENVVINRQEFPQLDIKQNKETSISLDLHNSETDYSRKQDSEGAFWIYKANTPLISTSRLKIAGLHNVSNAMAALALCEASGVSITNDNSIKKAMLEKLSQWPGLSHRCQYVGEKDGIRCYNDSKATNVGATVAAIEGLSETVTGKLVLIAGGDGKGADFTPLAEVFKRYLRALVLIGRDAERLLEEAGNGLHSVMVKDMKQAVSAAFSFAESDDAILLSPACASFDMYKNFEQRGDLFANEVAAVLI